MQGELKYCSIPQSEPLLSIASFFDLEGAQNAPKHDFQDFINQGKRNCVPWTVSFAVMYLH